MGDERGMTNDNRLFYAPYTMKGDQICPECGYTQEILYVEGERLPDQFDCEICGFSMHCSHYYEKEVPREVKGKEIVDLSEA